VKNPQAAISRDVQLARALWGPLSRPALIRLKELIERFGLSVARGELQFLYEGWYVTHAGLLGLAQRRHCAGIHVQQVREFCEPTVGRWVFKATVYRRRSSKGFVGYGDADPSNVSSMVRGAEMRVAETRPSIAPSARPTGSASVRSKSWVRSRARRDLPPFRPRPTDPNPPMVRATANPGSGISSAF